MKLIVNAIIVIIINVTFSINAQEVIDTLLFDNYTIISKKEYFNTLQRIITDINSECDKLTGSRENQKQIIIFFFKTKKEYIEYYKKLFGENPYTGNGGRCVIKKDAVVIFGYREVGFGSITHELVHARITSDWPLIPGWLNEALAQALGAPSQSVGAVYASEKLLGKGVYYTLGDLFKHCEKEYLHHIDREKIIDLGKMKVAEGLWLIGHSFVFYLKEKEFLEEFYVAYRDEYCIDRAIKNIGFNNIFDLQKDFFDWIKNVRL